MKELERRRAREAVHGLSHERLQLDANLFVNVRLERAYDVKARGTSKDAVLESNEKRFPSVHFKLPRYVGYVGKPHGVKVCIQGNVDLVVANARVREGLPRPFTPVAPAADLNQARSRIRHHYLRVSRTVPYLQGVQDRPLVLDDALHDFVVHAAQLHPKVNIELIVDVPLVVLPNGCDLVPPVPRNAVDYVLLAAKELLKQHALVDDSQAVDGAVYLVERFLHVSLRVAKENVVATGALVWLNNDLERSGGVDLVNEGLRI